MKTLKSDIFYAMNEINDKYILEAAQCLEQKKKSDISSQKKIKLFNESNAHSRKRLARVATAMAVSIILFTTGGIANAATGEKLVQWINGLFGAELVTDENEGLIGKEVIENSEPEVTHGEESDIGNAEGRAITESHIIKSVADDIIVLPLSVSDFKVENDTTPEIIMTNGSMAVFYLEDYAGWNCKAGDILTFSFEKYESDAVSNQALVLGYIKDGINLQLPVYLYLVNEELKNVVFAGFYLQKLINKDNKDLKLEGYSNSNVHILSMFDKSYENSKDCCENCICGDTIELLKKVETAWTLTEINSKGEYKYIKDSFINFHGIGKNKFAFFKGDKEVKGEFTINKNNEIILIPNDDKYSKITCKLGKEKDLIAVMNCDNNFGTFTLQKEGTIELPNIIKDTISKTKSIKVKGHQTITEEKQINTIISIINSSKVWTGAVTLPSPKYEIELFDVNNNNIAKILYNPDHYFNIEINKKRYELTNIDKKTLDTILEKKKFKEKDETNEKKKPGRI